MGFIGVTTGASSIRKVFPQWAQLLGLPVRRLVGHDLPLDASIDQYRALVNAIKSDPLHRGALVTTHKIGLLRAARDLFDEIDDLAETFGEVSAIAKRGSRLLGAAKDPVTVRLSLEEFLPDDHFSTSGWRSSDPRIRRCRLRAQPSARRAGRSAEPDHLHRLVGRFS